MENGFQPTGASLGNFWDATLFPWDDETSPLVLLMFQGNLWDQAEARPFQKPLLCVISFLPHPAALPPPPNTLFLVTIELSISKYMHNSLTKVLP